MLNGHRMMIATGPRAEGFFETLPRLSFHEVVEQEITRVIEIFPDGHTGIARSHDMLEIGGAGVPEHLDPEPDPVLKDTVTIEISREEFDRYWDNAIRRVELETGASIPT